tara:strand:+ start:2598 stop:2816 length:219 start_codon:yes stop_codon:yes gene_type:complete
MRQVHITHTGFIAGQTYCGEPLSSRSQAADGSLLDVYMHLPYVGIVEQNKFAEKHITCEQCKVEFYQAMDGE